MLIKNEESWKTTRGLFELPKGKTVEQHEEQRVLKGRDIPHWHNRTIPR